MEYTRCVSCQTETYHDEKTVNEDGNNTPEENIEIEHTCIDCGHTYITDGY